MTSPSPAVPKGPRIRRIHWNALPEATRRRLIDAFARKAEPRPIFWDTLGTGGPIAGWIFLSLLCLGALGVSLAIDYGSVCTPVQEIPLLAVDLALGFGAAYGLLAAIRTGLYARNLPFARGRYVFPMDVVLAQSERLEIIPMGAVTGVGGVHMHTNGAYTGTHVTFSFAGRAAETLVMHGKALADQALQQLRQKQLDLGAALDRRDLDWLLRNDVFAEARATDVWNDDPGAEERARRQPDPRAPIARDLPAPLAWASIPALVLALGVAPAWLVRNWLSDAEALSQLRQRSDQWAISDCECYLYGGGWHAAEVRDELMPAIAFRVAREAGTVAALRGFVSQYPAAPQVPEARASIHALFEGSRAAFLAQAATSDPAMPAFMGSLLGFLEAHDSPPVLVRFDAPSAAELGATDVALGAEIDRAVAPIAPWFTPERSLSREETVTRVLQRGFGAVFPNDVMTLQHSGRMTEGQPPDPAHAEIEVRYVVRPSGSVYESDRSARVFVGIFVDFLVTMRTPGSAQTYSFVLEVEPPEHFTVTTYGGYGGLGGGEPDDGAVYDEMARRAFDQLSARMGVVFFRPESAAYQSALAESDRIRAGDADPRGAGWPGGLPGAGGYPGGDPLTY